MTTTISLFRAARQVGTPLIAIKTPDPAATIEQLRENAMGESTPVIVWDVCQGWRPGNDAGRDAIREALPDVDPEAATVNPVEQLVTAQKLPDKSVLFAINSHRYLNDPSPAGAAFVQAVWNLRDSFKVNLRTLVLLAPSLTLPAELGGDVLVLDEALPTEIELGKIICSVLESAELPCEEALMGKATDALRGLAAFSAEQATAMAVSKDGLNIEALWERKRQMISATPGLAVWRGGVTLADVGGCDQIKRYARMMLAGQEAPRVVVFIDEIEKMLAGSAGDSSGVSQGQLQQLLVYMQDAQATGMIFVGPPGAAKSMIAKAIGAEGDIPTIALDLGGMKASLVGESEQRLRTALKVVDAVGGGRALFVATCNKIAGLPPELRRRFTMGTFFFDLPDAEERSVIWKLYMKKFGLLKQDRPKDESWTGAEIRQACILAYRLSIPLSDTPQFIVPVAKSAAEEIEALRRQADRKFLSASRPGVFTTTPTDGPLAPSRPRRAIAQEA